MTTEARVTPASAPDAATTWVAPDADAVARGARRAAQGASFMSLGGRFPDLEREAFDAAHAAGLAEGRAAGQMELRRRTERLDALLSNLARPFADLDQEVEQQLVDLALALARQLVRRELRIDPTQVIAIVREAVSVLPVSARDVRVHLHPEDAAIVREYLAPTENVRAWKLVEDPVMMRGGCQVATSTSRVDARLETRLGKLVAELVGGERANDPPPAVPA
jgi:flagellar assembly protein FliH